jgi:pullulanase/glycogen debranching enzyme
MLRDDLDRFYSDKQLGCVVSKSGTTFRLFAPRATSVTLVLYQRHDDAKGEEIHMVRDENGVWEYTSLGQLTGKYYGYRVDGPADKGEMFNPDIIIADPYSRAVATRNSYRHEARTLILDTKYDWKSDTFLTPSNHNELVVYEAHVRDLTAHPSSGVRLAGTYVGLTEKGKTGGLSYLKDLGVNAVELLPVQDFGNIEYPTALGLVGSLIPYGQFLGDSFSFVHGQWHPFLLPLVQGMLPRAGYSEFVSDFRLDFPMRQCPPFV